MELKDLSAEEILSAEDITIVPVEVPEWGGRVYVRSLSGTDRERYIIAIRRMVGSGKNRNYEVNLEESGAKLAQKTLCDKNGKLLFTSEQVEALGKKSSIALRRVTDAAAKLNGFTDDAEDEAKNASGPTTGSASSTASPATSA